MATDSAPLSAILRRYLPLAGFLAAIAVAVSMYSPRSPAPPETIVAELAGSDSGPVLVASVPDGYRFLTVKALAPITVPAYRALVLWMVSGKGGAPRSLGVVPSSGSAELKLPAPPNIAFRDIDALAVSLEPAGGSPTGAPSGPMLYTGRLARK